MGIGPYNERGKYIRIRRKFPKTYCFPPGGAEPRPYKLPRKEVTAICFLSAPSIDGSRSNATSCKFDTPVSGGAYQDARKVTLVWNDI